LKLAADFVELDSKLSQADSSGVGIWCVALGAGLRHSSAPWVDEFLFWERASKRVSNCSRFMSSRPARSRARKAGSLLGVWVLSVVIGWGTVVRAVHFLRG